MSSKSRRIKALLFVLLPLVAGCGFFEKETERKPIATAKDHVLHLDELLEAMPTGLSKEDSLLFANNFIQQWATQRLLLDRAELNLSDEQKNVKKQLDEYRRSLIIYLYQTEWVRQHMDTTVTSAEIDAYFESNKGDFELQEDIVRALFVKFGKQTNGINNVGKWMRSSDEELRTVLEDLAMQHALAMHLNENQWIPLNNLVKQFPVESRMSNDNFRSQGFVEFQDSSAHYFVYVKELKQKNTPAPVDYIRSNIANIILNKRKLELVKKLEKDIFNEALNKNQFKLIND
jgi:hypothetical protein